jgi:hypothetical protein
MPDSSLENVVRKLRPIETVQQSTTLPNHALTHDISEDGLDHAFEALCSSNRLQCKSPPL